MELHPATAKKYRIQDQRLVKVESRRGSVIVRSKVSESIREDTVFIPFHWDEEQNVNRLISNQLDPICHMPGFKVSAIKLSPI